LWRSPRTRSSADDSCCTSATTRTSSARSRDIEIATPAKAILDVEVDLAMKLVSALRHDTFDAERFHDTYAQRVREAVERKVAGEEFVQPPTLPGRQTLDLEPALRASFEALGVAVPANNVKGPSKAKPRAAEKAEKKRRRGDSPA